MVDWNFLKHLAENPIPDGELYAMSFDEVEEVREKVDEVLKKSNLDLKEYSQLNRLKTNILFVEDYLANPEGKQISSNSH